MAANNKENAVKELIEFINSDEKVILIKGTHQYEKHSLVLKLLTHSKDFKKGLVRSNSLQNIPTFLGHAGFKGLLGKRFAAGTPYNLNGTIVYFDSLFTRSTWGKSPIELDFAMIYPMDSFCESKKDLKDELLDDILRWKNIKKIFIVTWTDLRHDYQWLNEYVDRTVIFDAEDEDPEYHQRVLDLKNNRF
jgi:hypothetical protein